MSYVSDGKTTKPAYRQGLHFAGEEAEGHIDNSQPIWKFKETNKTTDSYLIFTA